MNLSGIKQYISVPGRKTEIVDRIFTLWLVLCPILQHYKSFYQDASTISLIIMLIYFGIKLLLEKEWHIGIVLPLIALGLYKVIDHGTDVTEIGREALLIVYFLAAASGAVNLKFYVKAAVIVASAAAVLIIVQYFCYYVLGFHLQLVATELLKSRAEQWIMLAQTGKISVSGNEMRFYRPSAFFLEPSHLTIYTFPCLAVTLISPKPDKKRVVFSVLLTLSLVLSTSGMGIALAAGIWVVAIFAPLLRGKSFKEKLKALFSAKVMLRILPVIAVVVLAYIFVRPLRLAVNRIFVNDSGGKNAIMARMGTGIKSVQMLEGVKEVLFGKAEWGKVSDWNMSGFFYTVYTHGFVGMIISYVFYVRSLFKVKYAYFWIGIIILVLSFVTLHTHAAFYMMYYVFFLMSGYPKDYRLVIPNKLDIAGKLARIKRKNNSA